MNNKDNKHTEKFRNEKLKPSESIIIHLEGWIGEMMGKGDKTQHNGQLIITNERVCFYRKGIFGEVFETIPIKIITSIEIKSILGYRVLRLHTSHDDLEFKTFEQKPLFDEVYEKIEHLRHQPVTNVLSSNLISLSVMDQLKELAKLRDSGFVTEDEFNIAKTQLLTRL